MTKRIVIRKARMEDARPIHALLSFFAEKREVLPRSLSEVYENLQQFFVAVQGREIVGTCALYVAWEGLAEVKALVVAPRHQRQGLGRRLLRRAMGEARKLHIERLFTLTIRDAFFTKAGFRRIRKSGLPYKVWTECVRCPYFPDACIETSMVLDLVPRKKQGRRDAASAFMASSRPIVPAEPAALPSVPPDPSRPVH